MGKSKVCPYCKIPIPVDEKDGRYFFYEHYNYKKEAMCKGSGKRAK